MPAKASPYRFEELGSFQFEQLCIQLLKEFSGLEDEAWQSVPRGRFLMLPAGVRRPGEARWLDGPAGVWIFWSRGRDLDSLGSELQDRVNEWARASLRSLLLLTNEATSGLKTAPVESVVVGPEEISSLVSSSVAVRLRMPSVLGIATSDELYSSDVMARSTADLGAARQLARVFVPTQAHAAALDVLRRTGFAALIGPPEMGKTAIARMIGLSILTDGWEVHECNSPTQLWARFARDRKQLFIADDAFGSTEYRPDAADRWAVELDRVLRSMDERHWLIWTSRPAPLKAGLRRIHREHGVERFPQPAEVQVDAAKLGVSEKALILFRHAKAASLPPEPIELVKAEGWRIVSHEHVTPERIRRFVEGGLVDLAGQVGSSGEIERLVNAEIREPTAAMAASFRALSDEHRTVLLALLDTPPGPVSDRELLAAFRRHAVTGFTRQPEQIIDRLTDHFLRVTEHGTITWVHPSWRDLVIDELVKGSEARSRFLRQSSIEGLVLALSTGGGASGERLLPLLQDDGDWDVVSDRLALLVSDLDNPGVKRLFVTLAEAYAALTEQDRTELVALMTYALELVAKRWDRVRAVIPVGLLGSWLELAALLGESRPRAPELAPTWIELVPTDRIDLDSAADLRRFDDWTVLAELLQEHEPEQLTAFGFPRAQRVAIGSFLDDVGRSGDIEPAPRKELLVRLLWRLFSLTRDYGWRAGKIALKLGPAREEHELPLWYRPRPLTPEFSRLLERQLGDPGSDEELVGRLLDDL